MQFRFGPILALLLACLPLVGQETAQETKRIQLMQREKLRILAVRNGAGKKGASALVLFKEIYVNLARGNQKQFADNQRIVAQLQEQAVVADKKRLNEKRDFYLRLAGVYVYYAKQNERIVKAYQSMNSAEIRQALEEIEKAEKKIAELGAPPAKREWFTFKELEKVPLPGQQTQQPTNAAAPKS